ncbi:3-methylfumaryl-CoA hydratase [Collimonas sp. OK607]|nr:3-methylfumaryl-CoA hydratase [Collimonas sp. OK607]
MFNSSEMITRQEICSLSMVRRVAAMLDIDPDIFAEGQSLPRGWQFLLMGADTCRSSLRSDGFPGLGVPMPDLGLPRLLLGGRSVKFSSEIPIGAKVLRTSSIKGLTQKTTDAGPMAVVTLAHELRLDLQSQPALVETQTYLLLSQQSRSSDDKNAEAAASISADRTAVVVPDDTLLFQFSALGFNSHKIHIDKIYARDVEGFPDLVVNGGLATLLLTEFIRKELNVDLVGFKTRHVAPLFCGRPMTLAAQRNGDEWVLKVFNDKNRLAVEMEVNI